MVPEAQLLQGKVAIITGGARGIGAACARLFAEHGAKLILADIDAAVAETVTGEINSAGGAARVVQTDVRRSDQVAEMVRVALSAYGGLHILVYCSGLTRPTPFEEISEEEWDLVTGVNLKGAFLCCKAVLPIMKQQRYGKIVTISSMAGRSVSPSSGAHYTSSKAGLLGLTRHLAREVASYGITANAICPGATLTRMHLETRSPEGLVAKARSIPMGRLAEPAEQARVILFLASDWSSFMTGASVDVNGGVLMM